MWVAVVVGGVVGDIGVRSLEADCSGSDVACVHEEVATVLTKDFPNVCQAIRSLSLCIRFYSLFLLCD